MANATYAEAAAHYARDPEAWWATAAQSIEWDQPWHTTFDPTIGPYGRWFVGGKLNTSFNCLDRHVASGRGDQDALIWDSAMTGEVRRYTYRALLDQVARFAGALSDLGVAHGDRVLIYMPMIPEAVIAMLACARLGAPHSVVFGGFAAEELAKRITNARPKIIVSASCGLEPGRTVHYKPMLDAAIEMSNEKPAKCVIVQRKEAPAELDPDRDVEFAELVARSDAHPPVPVLATDPLYILYTSGTTGMPKGIVRDNGGHAVALLRSMRMIYGMEAGQNCVTASDIGWVVGHSYIVYGPLLAGATTVLYEGKPCGTPDAGALWRLCETYQARMLFTAPTAVRAIRKDDPSGALAKSRDLKALNRVYLAGERCDPATAVWLGEVLQKPVVDHWWQTETGWAITAAFDEFQMPSPEPGSGGWPSPGFALEALDSDGRTIVGDETGTLAVRLPLPPGAAPTLWEDDDGFVRSYLAENPGYYTTGDAGRIDDNGAVWVMGRTDDIINVAGHRLSTGAMEEVLASHPDVAECAVLGVADGLKGQIPLGLVVLSSRSTENLADIPRSLVRLVRDRIGPVAAFKDVLILPALPKTRSGKILRKSMRLVADTGSADTPSTIEDVAVLQRAADIICAWRTRKG